MTLNMRSSVQGPFPHIVRSKKSSMRVRMSGNKVGRMLSFVLVVWKVTKLMGMVVVYYQKEWVLACYLSLVSNTNYLVIAS